MQYQKRIFSRSFFPGFLFEYIWLCQFSLIEIYSIVRSTCVRAGKKCSGCIWFASKYHNLTRIFFPFRCKKCTFILAERYSSLNHFISSIFHLKKVFHLENVRVVWDFMKSFKYNMFVASDEFELNAFEVLVFRLYPDVEWVNGWKGA